jgi:hypothetical protein
MARQSSLRQVLVRINQAVHDLATVNVWHPDDYRLYARFDEGAFVNSLQLLLEARAFPGTHEFDQWERVLDFLERKLKDVPELRGAMHLVIRTFDEATDEGYRTIRDSYTPIEELLASAPVV